MAAGALTMVVDRLRHSSRRAEWARLTDGQQLERFITDRSEAALAELIRRHGPTVIGVCQRILGNHADAEDAFQATFLVLVRKADQIKPRELVGHWLYGVARRTALCARKSLSRRRESIGGMTDMPSPKPNDADSELLSALDDELSRLPEKYRVAIVLCELEGRTIKQVAQQLGLSDGTIASRLHRGRALLAKRMKRFQPALTADSISSLLTSQSNGALPIELVATTAKAGAIFAVGTGAIVGITAQVAQLTEGVLKLMLLTKIKTATSAIVVLALMAGSGVAIRAATQIGPATVNDPPAVTAETEKKPETKPVSKMQRLWSDLTANDDVKLTKAILALAAVPKESGPFLQGQLKPVVVDQKKVRQWIADMSSDKEAVRDVAAKELDYIAPLIAEDLENAIENAPNDESRQRLVKILFDQPDEAEAGAAFAGAIMLPALPAVPGQPPVPAPPGGAIPMRAQAVVAVARGGDTEIDSSRTSWKQAIRAVTILEHIGGPDAVATLKKISEGDAKAAPTKAAKEALARMEKPAK